MNDSLFAKKQNIMPLASRMRPRTLEEFMGQHHILNKDSLLYKAIENDALSSIILSGPPGSGKTTLANIIAQKTSAHFSSLNAVLSGIADLKKEIDDAIMRYKLYEERTVLFVDEIHRWNKAHQDALLYHVENGTLILIGATTENPYFSVNSALLSRSCVFILESLSEEDLLSIASRALSDTENGYGRLKNLKIDDDALLYLVKASSGDARHLLNSLEFIIKTTPEVDGIKHISLDNAKSTVQNLSLVYDKDGDAHYDTISAFIKSLRGSDPDAALYWLARMNKAGEDPRFIFRRMLILASEDVGMAYPQAVSIVESDAAAFDRVGFPEGKYHLAHAALFLALCPKSDSVNGYFEAEKVLEEGVRAEDVPPHLRDSNRDKAKGDGIGYKYPHLYPGHYVEQQYLPSSLVGRRFYNSSDNGWEGKIKKYKNIISDNEA
ncbi:MAG: AAA family ATPase [Sphaerochaetaceae bacterium]|nr:AAA family ATPase [Sphaerochaetaceae bacterium]